MDYDKTSIAIMLVVGAVVVFVGFQVIDATAARYDKQEDWCNAHGGETTTAGEVIVCEIDGAGIVSFDTADELDYTDNTTKVQQAAQPRSEFESTYYPPLNWKTSGAVLGLLFTAVVAVEFRAWYGGAEGD